MDLIRCQMEEADKGWVNVSFGTGSPRLSWTDSHKTVVVVVVVSLSISIQVVLAFFVLRFSFLSNQPADWLRRT